MSTLTELGERMRAHPRSKLAPGDAVDVMPPCGPPMELRTVESVTARQIVLDNGSRWSRGSGYPWGTALYKGIRWPFICPAAWRKP